MSILNGWGTPWPHIFIGWRRAVLARRSRTVPGGTARLIPGVMRIRPLISVVSLLWLATGTGMITVPGWRLTSWAATGSATALATFLIPGSWAWAWTWTVFGLGSWSCVARTRPVMRARPITWTWSVPVPATRSWTTPALTPVTPIPGARPWPWMAGQERTLTCYMCKLTNIISPQIPLSTKWPSDKNKLTFSCESHGSPL